MSIWQEPKTTWKNSDYFNLSPDYQRIKGNIEYLHELSLKLFKTYIIYNLNTYQIIDFPKADFFNNIVYDVDMINRNTVNVSCSQMRSYTPNGLIWTYDDLNIIEKNIRSVSLRLKVVKNKSICSWIRLFFCYRDCYPRIKGLYLDLYLALFGTYKGV